MRATTWLALAALCGAGCDDDDARSEASDLAVDLDASGPPDAPADVAPSGDAEGAPDGVTTPDAAPGPAPGDRVEIDLDEYTGDAQPGAVRVFVSETEDDLIGGEAATARVGDYVLENDHVRFVVEGDDRVIGPCPYGGNVIDADIRRPEGEPGRDVVGELCLFLNAGRTMDPDEIEILADGSDGAGVLAVTGHLELLDFINVVGIAAGFLDGFELRLPFDTDAELPLTVTVYYVLRPGDRGLRVVTAIRNDGGEPQHLPTSHLVDSGGHVSFFSPTNSLGGFGYNGLSPESLDGEPLSVLAFRGPESTHAYMPDAVEGLSEDLPLAGRYFAVAGVAVSLLGASSVLRTLLVPPEQLPDSPAVLHIEAGATSVVAHWHLVGDGSLASVLDFAYAEAGWSPGTLVGTVAGPDGSPVGGARVSAVEPLMDAERTLNQALTGPDGRFSMRVPPGEYLLRAAHDGRVPRETPTVQVGAGEVSGADVVLEAHGLLRVRIRTPDGEAVAGKITVRCSADCPPRPTSREEDVTFDGPPGDAVHTEYVGVSGEATIALAPASYQVTVTHGPEWSIWPRGALASGGEPALVVAGETVELEADVAHVVDTTGAMSGDFHVHSVNSPDSPVPHEDRVRVFLAEGVDVLVSTDHDFITDYAPVIERLGASDVLASLVGEELTTFDYGHYNGFPLPRDPGSRNGGAFDWAGGRGVGRTPAEIFEWFASHEGTQVVQVNHPEGGYIRTVQADVLNRRTFADREKFRLPPQPPDPETGDTGLWSDDFTAMELMNGHSRRRFWTVARWWLTMHGRGFRPTGTAVSDTHKWYRSLGGSPRTWVFVDADRDSATTFDGEHFSAAVNAGHAIGSNGPYFLVSARNAEAEVAGPGDVLAAPAGSTVTIAVTLDLPEWMQVDRVDVFANPEGVVTGPGEEVGEPLAPTVSAPVEWVDEDLLEVAPGHRHRVRTVEVELVVERDSYVLVVVSGDEGPSMFPVVHAGARPFGFSNPLYLDADGGGYDHPPLAGMAAAPRRPTPPLDPGPLSEQDLRRVVEATAHQD